MPNPSIQTIASDFMSALVKSESLREKMRAAATGEQQMIALIQQTLKLPDALTPQEFVQFQAAMRTVSKEVAATEKLLQDLPEMTYWSVT